MAVTPEQKGLAKHRFERSETTLNEAKDELSRKNYRLAVNCAYYSVFYAMRAFLATVGKDSSKHSGVLSLFNQWFIKTKIIPEISFKKIQTLMDLRHEGDYQDFAVINMDEAGGAVETAGKIVVPLRKELSKILAQE